MTVRKLEISCKGGPGQSSAYILGTWCPEAEKAGQISDQIM